MLRLVELIQSPEGLLDTAVGHVSDMLNAVSAMGGLLPGAGGRGPGINPHLTTFIYSTYYLIKWFHIQIFLIYDVTFFIILSFLLSKGHVARLSEL